MPRDYNPPSSGYYGPFKPKAKPKPKPKAPPKRAQSLDDWSNQQAQRIVDAQVAAIKEQQQQYYSQLQDQARVRAEQARNFAQMVSNMHIDKNISDTYRAVGGDLAGMAQGFAGGTRDVAAQDAAQQMNMLSGTGQEGGVRNEGVNMGDVAYGVGGYIPGKSLGEQGAAFAADAAMQPNFMLQQALLESQRTFDEGMSQDPYADALMKARLGKFDIAQEMKQQRMSIIQQQQKMDLDRLDKDRKYWLAMKQYYLDKGKANLAKQAEARYRQAQNRYDQTARGLTPDGEVAPGFHRDPKTGRVIQNGYNANGVRIKTPGSDAKSGGLTANARAELVTKINNQEDEVKKVAFAKVKAWGVGPFPDGKKRRAALANELMKRYAYLTQGNAAAKSALRAMISRILKSIFAGEVSGGGSGLTDGLVG